jgi:hypothetical protein
MRIHRATAHAFGPLTGARLELADGLTVVYGPNESAKSSWHAALTAALCGLRRVAKSSEDLRYHPWDRPDWEVSAEIELADGRRIELRQDLERGIAGYAKDLVLGTDYAPEITGSERGEVPDASRWIGLDRRTFRATASVAQAQLAEVTERPEALHEHLQRAAATAGADETAAAALGRLEDFRRTQVGLERANSAGPLRRALNAHAAAQAALDQARQDHAEYDRRSAGTRAARSAAETARARVRARAAGLARATAVAWRERLAEADELTRLLDSAGPPPDPALAAEVSAALAAWQHLPRTPEQLDRAVPAEVSEVELRELERVLSRPAPAAPPADPALVAGPDPDEQARVDALVRGRRRWSAVLGLGVLVLVLAGVTFVLAPPAVASALAVVGLALSATGFLLLRRGAAQLAAARAALASARQARDERRIEEAAAARAAATARAEWQAAGDRCVELGIVSDPVVLRLLIDERAGRARDEHWSQSLNEARERALGTVRAVATRIGIGTGIGADRSDELIALLQGWLAAEPERDAHREQLREWRLRLGYLLDGGDLDGLRARADAAAHQAEIGTGIDSATSTPTDTPTALDVAALDEADLDVAALDETELDVAALDEAELGRVAEDAADAAARAEESLAAWAATLVPVAEAEERAAAAAAELEAVRALDRILGLTHDFLSRAQDRVNRAIAPRLAAAVGRDLAAVTGGRYAEAIVDPATLSVQVRAPGGRLRDAGGLSHGTTEQVYLLLRVALAEHLVTPGESCPLLLDDVTVHADGARTEQILELLLGVAERHQVVLFSQQQQVRDWARTRLTGPRHALRVLTPVPVS